jgi:hypothetical protein
MERNLLPEKLNWFKPEGWRTQRRPCKTELDGGELNNITKTQAPLNTGE